MNLDQLLKIPDKARDTKWEDLFLTRFTESQVRLLAAEAQQGPDGWPYLFVETDAKGTEPAQKLLNWVSTRGIGLAVNPTKEYPDFILTYGMLWSFRETGRFIHRLATQETAAEAKIESIEFSPQQLEEVGPPTAKYLPDYVRTVLRDFFRDQGILQPKVLVIKQKGHDYDLGFSLESLGNPPEPEWQGIGEALSWFLPPHYSVVLVSEKNLPAFVAL